VSHRMKVMPGRNCLVANVLSHFECLLCILTVIFILMNISVVLMTDKEWSSWSGQNLT
jgi:hypothetical protein